MADFVEAGNKSEGASSSKLRRRQERRKKPKQREKKKEKARLKSDVNEAFSKEKEKMLYEIGFTEVEDMVTLLSLASLLDRSIANPSGSREMALGDRFTIEELDTLSDFAPQCACFKPMNWKYSHSENISASMVHVKKFIEKSVDTMKPGNFTYADIYSLSERMLNSPFFTNVKKDVDVPVTTQLWGGGSLREWSDHFNDQLISQVVCCTGSGTQTQLRLTDMGRKVLRGLMKSVGDLYEHELNHGNLDIDQVLVSSNFEVYLVDHPKRQNMFSRDGYKVDCKALHKVIREMLKKQNYPKDVLHLLRLLREADWKRRDLIFSHTCIWSPSETIRTILAFRIEFFTGNQKNMIKEKARKILKTVTQNWEERIPKGEPYEDCYKHWLKDLEERWEEARERGENDDRPNGMMILLFMRSCIGHAHSNSKHLKKKTDLEVEADLFVIFPDFMPNFIESMEDMLKDVWKI